MQPVLVPITIVVNSILMGDSIVVKHNFGSGAWLKPGKGTNPWVLRENY